MLEIDFAIGFATRDVRKVLCSFRRFFSNCRPSIISSPSVTDESYEDDSSLEMWSDKNVATMVPKYLTEIKFWKVKLIYL